MAVISDPIADLFTRIRNALKAEHRYIDVGRSKVKIEIVKLLQAFGYVGKYLEKDLDSHGRGVMRVYLKYDKDRAPVIENLKRVSKPGIRSYVNCKEIPLVHGGIGMAILSTSQGVLSGKEARRLGIGGELLGIVW